MNEIERHEDEPPPEISNKRVGSGTPPQNDPRPQKETPGSPKKEPPAKSSGR